MKTTVPIPGNASQETERLTTLTEAMNLAVEELGSGPDEFTQRASLGVMEHVEWQSDSTSCSAAKGEQRNHNSCDQP